MAISIGKAMNAHIAGVLPDALPRRNSSSGIITVIFGNLCKQKSMVGP